MKTLIGLILGLVFLGLCFAATKSTKSNVIPIYVRLNLHTPYDLTRYNQEWKTRAKGLTDRAPTYIFSIRPFRSTDEISADQRSLMFGTVGDYAELRRKGVSVTPLAATITPTGKNFYKVLLVAKRGKSAGSTDISVASYSTATKYIAKKWADASGSGKVRLTRHESQQDLIADVAGDKVQKAAVSQEAFDFYKKGHNTGTLETTFIGEAPTPAIIALGNWNKKDLDIIREYFQKSSGRSHRFTEADINSYDNFVTSLTSSPP